MSRNYLLVFLVVFCFVIASLSIYTDAVPPGTRSPKDHGEKKEPKKIKEPEINEQKSHQVKPNKAVKNKVEKDAQNLEQEHPSDNNVQNHLKKDHDKEEKEEEQNTKEVENQTHEENVDQHVDESKHIGVGKTMKQEIGKKFKLSKHPSCADDVKQLCTSLPKDNNFAVLVCLQDAAAKDDDQVSDDCHQLLWEYKKNLTSSVLFDNAAFEVCQSSIVELKDCTTDLPQDGSLVNCLVEKRELVKNQKCQNFLTKMAAIVFSDYRLIKGFYKQCHGDVKKFNCGKVSSSSTDPHTQAEVIECLEDNVENLTAECQNQIKRVAELSSDDYHMDRAVFYACQDARERFCSEVQAGQGRIFKCLMEHKFETTMSDDCKEKLTVRQKLGQEDVKANHALWEYCEKDFNTYQCKKGETEHGKSSHLILCLNQAIADGMLQAKKFQVLMKPVITKLNKASV